LTELAPWIVATPVPSRATEKTARPLAAVMLICDPPATVRRPLPSGKMLFPPTATLAPALPRLVMSTWLPLVMVAKPVLPPEPTDRLAPERKLPVCWPDSETVAASTTSVPTPPERPTAMFLPVSVA
jgi:hypothetical protein